ncbi:MAG TPA: hypothetical protein VFZ21_01360, partial [Gemmatimonadaceae bacterium]|nr:hypothetical protein [Gemmatimonadaceae bacterium]
DTEEYETFWTSFFEALYKNMAAKGGLQPTVLLRACLTASNEIDVEALKKEMAKDGRIDVSKVDPTTPENQVKIRAGIVEYIKRHGSLAKVLGDKAGKRAKVVGAQASIDVESVGSINTATGQLELVPASDPMVGGTKFQYVRAGKEPLGVMRAVIEAWAVDKDKCFDQMNERILDSVTTIDELIIHTLYRTILNTYSNDILTANALTATATVLSGVTDGGSRCRPAYLRNDPMVRKHRGLWYRTLLNNVSIGPEVVLLQDWMAIEPLAESVFLSTMSKSGITWSPVAPYLDFEILAPHLNALLSADTSNKRGRIIVALVGAIERDNALSKAYLRGQTDENGKLPDEVKDELGTYSERQLRTKLGLPSDEAVTEPKTTKSATTVKPAHPQNIAQKFHVKPMAEIKTMNKSSLSDWAKVRRAPDDGAEELESQYRTKDYHIDGEVQTLTGGETGWYMVRTEQGRAGYIRKKYF